VKIFLAGSYTRERLFLAHNPKYILESFFYVKPWQIERIREWECFLLDSGAFTFLTSQKNKNVNWNQYVERYAAFIKDNNIENYFELDIDPVIGYDQVLKIRNFLESKTGKKCIPVWHRSRGKEDFLRTCDEYGYIAIGGIVSKEIKKQDYDVFYWLIEQAHLRGAKVHGLGFTNLEGLTKYKFDSVDSTSWLSASRYGQVHYFDGKTIRQRTVRKGEKTVYYQKMDDFVFGEWVKFQKYAEVHL
jgi:hypothetical protein